MLFGAEHGADVHDREDQGEDERAFWRVSQAYRGIIDFELASTTPREPPEEEASVGAQSYQAPPPAQEPDEGSARSVVPCMPA